MEKKLQAKDLIRIGIFTAIYFVIFFATGIKDKWSRKKNTSADCQFFKEVFSIHIIHI